MSDFWDGLLADITETQQRQRAGEQFETRWENNEHFVLLAELDGAPDVETWCTWLSANYGVQVFVDGNDLVITSTHPKPASGGAV